MDWFQVTTANEEVHLINVSAILSVMYHEDTDLTEITFIRSAFSPIFVRGDIMLTIKRLLTSHDHYVSTITV